MYLDYVTYQTYGGGLTETEFNRFNFKAETKLNELTFNRIKGTYADERVKRCVFELIEAYAEHKDGTIKSASNDGVSVSYAEESIKDIEYSIVSDYFAQTGLMYCGVGADVGQYAPMPDEGWEFLQVRKE